MENKIIIDHNHAVSIENIVTGALRCKPGAYGFLVSADRYQKYPMEAAVVCVIYFCSSKPSDEISEAISFFFTTWTHPEDWQTQDDFVNDLSQLVSVLQNPR